ncbi:C39 family peptidase [Fictibacillus iocasae]|uniref:C39 family peptidase n=1 Tax=Fictibacillus iocasae TaxID=2715437 RepID=A0ABW2NNQ3_9BACL
MIRITKYLVAFMMAFSLVTLYLPAEQASAAATPINKAVYVSVDVANIRSGASLSYKVIAQLKTGAKMTAYEQFTNSKNEIWYHVVLPDGRKGWVASWIVTTTAPPATRVILSAPLISQMPELPRGCEVTSLAMMLQYAGKSANKMTLASQVKKDPTPYRKAADGKVYFGNPYVGFVGNMYDKDKPGYGVYHGPVASLARQYLGTRVVDLTGKTFQTAVIGQLQKKKPVWVIANSWFTALPASQFTTFYTPQGPVKVTYREHSVLVTGFDSQYIYFNDPLTNQKNRKVARSSFAAAWDQMGKQAISYN